MVNGAAAEDGGFPVKGVRQVSGKDDKRNDVNAAWSMELKDANQSITINPPK